MTFLIPGSPVTKKNSQVVAVNKKTGKPFIRQSERYNDFETAASYFLRPRPTSPIDYPVTVRCIYYMPTKRRVDMTNLMAATHDVLVKYGILSDDNRDIIASVDGSMVLYDKANPRTEIEIMPYTGEYQQWKG